MKWLNVFLNVTFLGGRPQETISVHAARARQEGARWGCVLCRWLSRTVERDHCDIVLDSGSTHEAMK